MPPLSRHGNLLRRRGGGPLERGAEIVVPPPPPPSDGAPDYSAYVTRRTIGYSGAAVEQHLDETPLKENAGIVRLACECASITEYYTLNGAVNASATSMPLTLPGGAAPPSTPFDAWIDDELVVVTALSGSGTSRTATVTRGVNGTTAAAHTDNAGFTCYLWSGLDAKVKTILNAGVEICMLVSYNNPQYSGFTAGDNIGMVPSKNAVSPHTGSPDPNGHTFDQWTTWWSKHFARAVVNRYHHDGNRKPTTGVLAGKIQETPDAANGKGCVRFYQIWNECNNQSFWKVDGTDNYIKNGLFSGIQDVAELLAKVYTQIKSVSAKAYMGCGGTAGGRLDPPTGNGARSYVFYRELLNKWAAMGYTKPTNGWADGIALDWACHHAYVYQRGGGSQVSTAYSSVVADYASNGLAVDTVKVHNEFVAAGYPSIKIWCTESDYGWDDCADTNYGFRGWTDAGKTSYQQKQGGNWEWFMEDRAAMSPAEGYTYICEIYGYWTGYDETGARVAWPPATLPPDGTGNRPRWAVLNKKTPAATDELPLGPKFHFTGTLDFDLARTQTSKGPNPGQLYPKGNGPSGDYHAFWDHASHFGFWHIDGSSKRVAGNDPIDAFLLFPRKP